MIIVSQNEEGWLELDNIQDAHRYDDRIGYDKEMTIQGWTYSERVLISPQDKST